MNKSYGDKRDYAKIDLYVDGKYVASTTWSRTIVEAVEHYKNHKHATNGIVTGHRAVK